MYGWCVSEWRTIDSSISMCNVCSAQRVVCAIHWHWLRFASCWWLWLCGNVNFVNENHLASGCTSMRQTWIGLAIVRRTYGNIFNCWHFPCGTSGLRGSSLHTCALQSFWLSWTIERLQWADMILIAFTVAIVCVCVSFRRDDKFNFEYQLTPSNNSRAELRNSRTQTDATQIANNIFRAVISCFCIGFVISSKIMHEIHSPTTPVSNRNEKCQWIKCVLNGID